MKVEHLTFGGNSVVRDTDDVEKETREFFKPLQLCMGVIERFDIKGTKLNCKVTIDSGMAAIDMKIGNDILTTSFCCFSKEDMGTVMSLVRDIVTRIYGRANIIRDPKEEKFIYTIMIPSVLALNNMDQLELAGEIELYIYDAIRIGISK